MCFAGITEPFYSFHLLYTGHFLHKIRIASIPIERRRDGREALEERKPLYDSLKSL